MARIKLTTERIRKAECPQGKKKIFLWDSLVSGLGISITPTSKSFVFQDKLDGKTVRMRLGDIASWPIDSPDPTRPGARQEAARLKTLFDQGIDPREEKKEREQKRIEAKEAGDREKVTVGDIWPDYIEERRPSWSDRHYLDHIRISHPGGEKKKRGKGKTVPGAMASLMPVRLCDLTAERVKDWVVTEAKIRPGQTRLAYSALRAFVNWCDEQPAYQGLADPDAFSGNQKRNVLPKQKPKSDTLQREQLSAWFTSVKMIRNKVISAYLQILLLSGARREELLGLRWEDVDFTWKSLTIKDKVDGTRTIPLTPYTEALLNYLPKKNQWVFSSNTSKSGRLQEPSKAHKRALVDAGIEHLTLHGLRRSFANLSEWLETPVGIVYQIQGHKPSATAEKHYRQRPLDLLRKWHTKIETWILKEARVEIPQKAEHLTVVKAG